MQTSIYSTLIHEILAQGHTDVHGQIPDRNGFGGWQKGRDFANFHICTKVSCSPRFLCMSTILQ